jgi:hypothetical protein
MTLADSIDPRKRNADAANSPNKYTLVLITDLIAASDALRALPSLQDERVATVRALAIEEAAKACDALADASEPWAEEVGIGEILRNGRRAVVRARRECAATIRALQPTLEIDALVERGARAMLAELKSNDVLCKHVDDIWASDIIDGELDRMSRAVITEILGAKG